MVTSEIISKNLMYKIITCTTLNFSILVRMVGQNKNVTNHSQHLSISLLILKLGFNKRVLTSHSQHLWETSLHNQTSSYQKKFESLIVSNHKVLNLLALKN